MQRRQEGDLRVLADRMAQRQGAVCREFGHQPVGQRLDAVLLLRFRRFRPGVLPGLDPVVIRPIRGLVAHRHGGS